MVARTCAVQLLAALKAEIGDLSKVKRIVRVGGFVNCTDDFTAQSKVINGASDLFVAVFGPTKAAMPAPPWVSPPLPLVLRWNRIARGSGGLSATTSLTGRGWKLGRQR